MLEIHYLGQVLLALLLGGLLGWNRERDKKPAGLRTYALVSAGSALFTIISMHSFGDQPHIAAQIVTGIGFIGAGTILHKKDHVEGITTAAGLWMVAGIGMAVGVGYYVLSILSTVLIGIVLFINDKKLLHENHTSTEQTTMNLETKKEDSSSSPTPNV